jgi:hypothetical protein
LRKNVIPEEQEELAFKPAAIQITKEI